MGCNASQAVHAGRVPESEGRQLKPATGILLGRERWLPRKGSSFYFVQHVRKNKLNIKTEKDFWAWTVAFWKYPQVFKKSVEDQKNLGVRAHNFFPIDRSKAYSTWEIQDGGDRNVLQHYLDSDICRDMKNMLIRMDWQHDTKFRPIKKAGSGWTNPAASDSKERFFFFVKHTVYNDEDRWLKMYVAERTDRKDRQKELGLRNHQFNMCQDDFVFSIWEGKEGIRADDLQQYLDTELCQGHIGSEVFQVYGMKNLHPFAV